jgi:hypothetical protein
VYLSEIGKLDANPGKKERNNYDLNTKNKDGHDTKCQHIDKKGGKKDAKPDTKKRLNYDLNTKHKDGLDTKWQHSGKKGANKLVGDGTGTGTTVRACVKAANKLVDDGNGTGTKVRVCVKGANTCNKPRSNCITCKMVPRARSWEQWQVQSVSARGLLQHVVQERIYFGVALVRTQTNASNGG